MAKIDIFDGSDFTMASLTEAINKLPFPPTRLGNMGLFEERPITTDVAHIEDRQGSLGLLPIGARGSMEAAYSRPIRTTRDFKVPHIPYFGQVLAADIQNIRAFGSETELESAAMVVNDVMANMLQDHAVTAEYHRSGAIQGLIKDADGSTYKDLFSAFDVTETDIAFDFTDGAADMETVCSSVHRAMSTALGATPYTGIIGVCGNQFFDWMAANSNVRLAYDRYQDGEFLRRNKLGPDWSNGANGFTFQDIYFFNYRGTIGTETFIPDNDCRFVAVGAPGLFIEILAPPDALSLANTRGQRYYASQERLAHDKGIEIHTQSNVLPMCTRPASLIKGSGSSS